MRSNQWKFLAAVFFLVSSAAPGMNLGYLYPAGGARGATVEITAGGLGFSGIKDVFVTGGGVELESVETVRGFVTPSPGQRDYLMRGVRAVVDGKAPPEKPVDTSDWRKMHPYWEKLDQLTPLQLEMVLLDLCRPRDRLQMSPALAQRAIIRLRISPDAATGRRELRLFNGRELSNPLPFHIDSVSEISEPRFEMPPRQGAVPEFKPGMTLNGQILPGECDRFTFRAKRGETIGFDLHGRRLLPIIGDGVPGSFQPVLEIFGPGGKTAAFADDWYFAPDPLLNFTAPADGVYTVAIRDALYRGREDFVYRLVTAARRLDRRQEAFPELGLPRADAGGKPIRLPGFIDGVIDAPGECDEVRFYGGKGETVVLEVFARRCGSPLDSRLRLTGGDGTVLAVGDDCPRAAVGPRIHDADSRIECTLPGDGEYRVEISDVAGSGGEDYRYRLRLDRPRPDFRVWSVPSALTVSQDGDAEELRVLVERIDGFSGELTFEMEPAGRFEICGSRTLDAGASEGVLTVRARGSRDKAPVRYRLNAVSGGVRHPVEPADEYTQAFATRHLLVAEEAWFVPGWKRFGGRLFSWDGGGAGVVRLAPGGTAELRVKVGKLEKDGRIEFALGGGPEGLRLESFAPAADGVCRLKLAAAADAAAWTGGVLVSVNYSFTQVEKSGREIARVSRVLLPRLRVETVRKNPEKH